ncbi:MAG: Mrp/NBP35 family ATP-binding protein [Synergistetes bacterium]|nr:Mrp/NBP35 family ATP-binding protein [Synergistota bacterium]
MSKSTIVANFVLGLTMESKKVDLLNSDSHESNIPKLLEIKSETSITR